MNKISNIFSPLKWFNITVTSSELPHIITFDLHDNIKKKSYLWCNVKQICSFVYLTKNLHSTTFDMFAINI